MSIELTRQVTAREQKDAPQMFGTHFDKSIPFSKYHPAFKYFFDSLPKKESSITLLDASCGNENRVMSGLKRHNGKINIESVDLIIPDDIAPTPNHVSRVTRIADLKNDWNYANNTFDGLIFAWSLHWFGFEGSQNALDNLARVLKHGSDAIISTLSPFDCLIKNSTYYRNIIGKNQLKNMFPNARILRSHNSNGPTWIVENDLSIKNQIKDNHGYVIKESNSLSVIGNKSLIGFTPEYLKNEFKRRKLKIIMEVTKPNTSFPNGYNPTLAEGRSHLIYVVRKI